MTGLELFYEEKLAEFYGTLIFYHFGPEEAMEQLFELIDISFNTNLSNE